MQYQEFEQLATAIGSYTNKQNEPITIDYLLINHKEVSWCHQYHAHTLSDIRSLSKTVMTILLGRLMLITNTDSKTPLLTTETLVLPTLAKAFTITNKDNLDRLSKLKVKHLLTHNIGYNDVLLMRGDIQDRDYYTLVDYLLNYPIEHDPGSYYLYSNAGFYLLSVFLQEYYQEDLLSIAQRELFDILGITQYEWERYGNYLAGATRLWLYPQDLVKFGQILLNNGMYGDQQIISEEWVDQMRTPSASTPDLADPSLLINRQAYGHGLWLSHESVFFGHGTDGQILAIDPVTQSVVVSLSREVDLKPIERAVDQVLKRLRAKA